MKTSRFFIIFLVIFTIVASVFSSAVTLKILFPQLLNQYSSGENQTSSPLAESGQSIYSPGLRQIESGVKSIAKNLRSSVVNIVINQDVQLYRSDPFGFFYEPSGTVRKQVGGGTGFFITRDGLILTNKHVVSEPDATYTIITSDNEEFVGKVVAIDPQMDLAIIRAVTKDGKNLSNRTPVQFVQDIKSVDVGTFVIAMGNALAQFQNTLTFGIISGLGRTIEAGSQSGGDTEQLSGLFQTDAAINPGNSGGPLVNLDGKVIGINTAVATGANGLGFALPLSSRDVDYLLQSLKKYNAIKRPFLGIKYMPIDKNLSKANNLSSEYGDIIAPDGVIPGSPADQAGLKPGDILIESDGKVLKNGTDLKDTLLGKFPGENLNIKVFLHGTKEQKSLQIKLGSI